MIVTVVFVCRRYCEKLYFGITPGHESYDFEFGEVGRMMVTGSLQILCILSTLLVRQVMYKENNTFISSPQQQIDLFDWPEQYEVVNS